jgi:starch-binding outer membrane protein, SusD/RagB family
MYYNLVKEFGDVPVVTERITTIGDAAALTMRQPRQVVYDQIVADLKDVVASNLPVTQPASGKGRVSLQAANGLLGLVYLTMGTSLDAANSQANFTNAKTYLLACYNQKTFANLSDIPFADVFDVNKKMSNPEIIWQIQYKQGDPSFSSALACRKTLKRVMYGRIILSNSRQQPPIILSPSSGITVPLQVRSAMAGTTGS